MRATDSPPLGWTKMGFDPSREGPVGSVPRMAAGDVPMIGSLARFVVTSGRGVATTEGTVVRVVDENRFVAELVFTSDEELVSTYPILVVLARSAGTEWTTSGWEPTYSDAKEDALLEDVRVESIRARWAHLGRRVREAAANRFAAAMFEQDRPMIEAAIQRIQRWHADTRRAWPLVTDAG